MYKLQTTFVVLIMILLHVATARAGSYSATAGPFLLNTGIPRSSTAVTAPTILLNTFDIATSTLGSITSAAFVLDTQGENPTISVVVGSVQQNPTPSGLVWITYNLFHNMGVPMTVTLQISGDGGLTWNVPVVNASGDIGPGITSGSGKRILWNAGVDWPNAVSDSVKVRITANDAQ